MSYRFLLLLFPVFAFAHAISVSTGEGNLEGTRLELTLRIPPYEAEHLLGKTQIPADTVGKAISFTGARLESSSCRESAEELTCRLRYIWSGDPGDDIEAEVTLARYTVPNHVVILRLRRGETERQSIFDRTFERDTIRLREPTSMETAWQGLTMGAAQLRYQPVMLVLLITLAAVAGWRAWPYFVAGLAAFLLVLPDKFYADPGFFELTTTLGIAYLTLDQIFFPAAKGKWIGLAVVGALEGAGLAILARPAAKAALGFGFGNMALQALLCALAVLAWRSVPQVWRPQVLRQGTLWALAAFGLGETVWLFFRRF